jgi:hypothetical protein
MTPVIWLSNKTSFSSHVPPPETARFQERLRYIICTSQLLSEKITPSLYPNVQTKSDFAELHRIRTTKYWAGTGGCVIVVALLISWTLRDTTRTKAAKPRNIAALAIGLLIAVCFYASAVASLASLADLASSVYSTSKDFDTRIGRGTCSEQSSIRHNR